MGEEVVVIKGCYMGVIGTISEIRSSDCDVKVDGIEEPYSFPLSWVMQRSSHKYWGGARVVEEDGL